MTELIDFHANWCHPCRIMEPIIEEVEREYQGKFNVTRIDVDKKPQEAAVYNILSIPTFIVKKEGKVVEQFSGVVTKAVLLKKLGF